MKNRFYLSLLFSVFCMLTSLPMQGQTYFNFVMGHTSLTYNSSRSVVRTVDAQRAIAYYEDGSSAHKLARIGMDGIVHEAQFGNNIIVSDMRIFGDDIFFCGWNTSSRRGIIGHALVSAIEGYSQHMDYFELDMGISSSENMLYRLAAYKDDFGRYKVVAIGEMNYDGNAPLLYPALTCPGTLYPSYNCHAYFVVACEYIPSPLNSLTLEFCKFFYRYLDRFDHVDDVVLTDNWVAIVTSNADRSELTIHRCDKNNLLGTFTPQCRYKVPYLEGGYRCCRMKGDTIALVAMYASGSAPIYETHMRTIDLASMTMTNAQGYGLLDKTDPIEVVYLPDYTTLVMSQYQKFPLTGFHYAYVFWRPYKPTPYTADVIYEGGDRPLGPLDRLTHKHIVTSGGNYWVEKDISYNNPSSSCYKIAQQQVSALDLVNPVWDNFNYWSHTPTISGPILLGETYLGSLLSVGCIEY